MYVRVGLHAIYVVYQHGGGTQSMHNCHMHGRVASALCPKTELGTCVFLIH